MTRARGARAAVAVVTFAGLIVAVVAAGIALAQPGEPVGEDPDTITVTLTIRHSRFSPDRISVRAGTTVRFVIENADPIGHELIVGDDEVHLRHESGTEASHPPRPGEVSVGALETAETTFRFDQPDSVLYACHLPGHLAYGMSGYVEVVER